MAELHERNIDESKIDTVLAEDLSFEGEVSFTKEMMIKGRFNGKIRARGVLHIGPQADVEAEIEAASVYVRGRVKGSIKASSRVELQDDAEVFGDITAPKIVMNTGCRFDGVSHMQTSKEGAK